MRVRVVQGDRNGGVWGRADVGLDRDRCVGRDFVEKGKRGVYQRAEVPIDRTGDEERFPVRSREIDADRTGAGEIEGVCVPSPLFGVDEDFLMLLAWDARKARK